MPAWDAQTAYLAWLGETVYAQAVGMPEDAPPLAERLVGHFSADLPDPSPGRRLRVFALLVQGVRAGDWGEVRCRGTREVLLKTEPAPTYAQAYAALAGFAGFTGMPLRIKNGADPSPLVYTGIPEIYVKHTRDADLHPALQDLARQIIADLVEACGALDDPDLWYPGVDEGIEPVTDEHVRLVTWATQRELRRELRAPFGAVIITKTLPEVELAELPWRVQRAFAERRRWRYLQWGIGRAQWEHNSWSLWDVPEDPEWVPPWT